MSSQNLYGEYVSRMQKIADVKYAAAVLQWDQETYMPVKGSDFRARQLATLSEIAHEWITAPDFGNMLKTLNERTDLSADQQRNITLTLEDYEKQKKFSPAFVRQLSETTSRCFTAWIKARQGNSFSLFQEDLSRLVELKKEEAQLAGYEQHPYNALLDQYEKGATVSLLDNAFNQVRAPLKDLRDRILAQPAIDDSFMHQHFPRQQQWDFGMDVIRSMGFDFEAGRQDISEHPFTTNFNKFDVRITTRIDEEDFGNMLWSCIHETGHGLYEQGLPEKYYGLPLGEYASLSIHESQSRLWENNVGRSATWWCHWYPILQQRFPNQLGKIGLDHFYRGMNKVSTNSLIRTEADEISYHFHVMIRYELEKKLIEGTLRVADIPEYWNQQYAAYLNVTVPDDKQGCLQDIHWSHGSFGYFPTYSLGSFYAAQLFKAAENQDTNIAPAIEKGETAPLLQWLRQHIHQYGRQFTSEELCQLATGQTLDIQYFLHYLLDKYNKIYNF